MRLPALASLTVVSLVAAGCATQGGSLEGTPVDTTRPGRAGVVVAAPQGRSDQGTAVMAAEIARLTGFGLVVATGSETDEGAAYERRVRETARGPLILADFLREAITLPLPARR